MTNNSFSKFSLNIISGLKSLLIKHEEVKTYKVKEGYLFCEDEEIVYFKAAEKHTIVYLKDGSNYELRNQSIGELEKCISNRPYFVRTHRSYIINQTHCRIFSREKEHFQMRFSSGKIQWIPVSIRYFDKLKKGFYEKSNISNVYREEEQRKYAFKTMLVFTARFISLISKPLLNLAKNEKGFTVPRVEEKKESVEVNHY